MSLIIFPVEKRIFPQISGHYRQQQLDHKSIGDIDEKRPNQWNHQECLR